MVNRGKNSLGDCVELCSASLGGWAAGVSGRAFALSFAPRARRGVGGAWCHGYATVREYWHRVVTVVARGGSVPVCAKIFLWDLAGTAAVSYANTPNGVGEYWHKTQHSTPRAS
jgi:hypothetical protein